MVRKNRLASWRTSWTDFCGLQKLFQQWTLYVGVAMHCFSNVALLFRTCFPRLLRSGWWIGWCCCFWVYLLVFLWPRAPQLKQIVEPRNKVKQEEYEMNDTIGTPNCMHAFVQQTQCIYVVYLHPFIALASTPPVRYETWRDIVFRWKASFSKLDIAVVDDKVHDDARSVPSGT